MEPITGVIEGIFCGPMEGIPDGFSLPKQSIKSVTLTKEGIIGDSNKFRYNKKKGDPDMAVLLLTIAELEELNIRGFSIQPGDFGENILLDGIHFTDIMPDMRLSVGDEVILQVSRICDPCSKLSQIPAIGKTHIKQLLQESNGLRGWYARVIQGGNIGVGEIVTLLQS
jgi:MOSC domain-containing protein YiiM